MAKKCGLSKKELRELREWDLYGTGKIPKKIEKNQGKLVSCILREMKKKGEL